MSMQQREDSEYERINHALNIVQRHVITMDLKKEGSERFIDVQFK